MILSIRLLSATISLVSLIAGTVLNCGPVSANKHKQSSSRGVANCEAKKVSLSTLMTKFESAKDAESKEEILVAITQNYSATAAGQLLLLATRTTDSTTRWMAFRGIGELKYRPAMPFLIQSLKSEHHYVRANAARALGDIGEGQKTPPDDAEWNHAKKSLVELLAAERDDGVLEQTSLALQLLKATDAVPVLKTKARQNSLSPQTRGWIVGSVGKLGSEKDLPFLAGFLDDKDSFVEMVAAQEIERITGQDFGFPKQSGPMSPTHGIGKARTWWAQNREKYQF